MASRRHAAPQQSSPSPAQPQPGKVQRVPSKGPASTQRKPTHTVADQGGQSRLGQGGGRTHKWVCVRVHITPLATCPRHNPGSGPQETPSMQVAAASGSATRHVRMHHTSEVEHPPHYPSAHVSPRHVPPWLMVYYAPSRHPPHPTSCCWSTTAPPPEDMIEAAPRCLIHGHPDGQSPSRCRQQMNQQDQSASRNPSASKLAVHGVHPWRARAGVGKAGCVHPPY